METVSAWKKAFAGLKMNSITGFGNTFISFGGFIAYIFIWSVIYLVRGSLRLGIPNE